MFEQLLQLVQQHAQDQIVNNQQIPNEHNDTAIKAVTEAISSGLSSQLSSGNMQGVMSLMNGTGGNWADNPIVKNIMNSAAGSIAQKAGVTPEVAANVASSLIPTVMQQFQQQTADPNNNNFTLQGVLGALSGGKAGGLDLGNIGGMIGNLLK